MPGNRNEPHALQTPCLDSSVELHQRARKSGRSSNADAGVRRILDFMLNLIVLSSPDVAILQNVFDGYCVQITANSLPSDCPTLSPPALSASFAPEPH